MSDSPYTVRNFQPADFDEFVRLNIAAEEIEPRGRCFSSQAISERLRRPGYSPERDLFTVETGGKIIGCTDLTPEPAIGRVILDCWIHPGHRRRGLATRLLGCVVERAGEMGVRVAHSGIREDNTVAAVVLSRLGFKFVRRFLELKLAITDIHPGDSDPAVFACRHLKSGEEAGLTRIQNSSFSNTWGYNPNTVETIAYRLNLADHSPDDVVLACRGEEILGYCWTEVICEGGVPSKRRGRIFMLGTDPAYQGQGVGKRVLLAGLAHLKSKGLRVAELTVDSENETARGLYRSIGFEVETTTMWYEKDINQ